MAKKLGELHRVDLREFWRDEARDFTPWLAEEDNLELLGEILGLDIELGGIDVSVGNFRADILAKEISGDRKIIIENQLGRTDHDHLGKLITYASGLEADIIVWICRSVTDEHREAIDWLNEITREDVFFFALEIELWRIENSLPAPKFNIVCSPNEWAKSVRESSGFAKPSETQLLQQEFWSGLKEHMTASNTSLRLPEPRARQWYSIAVGRSNFQTALTVNTRTNTLGCELYLHGDRAKKAFSLLLEDKEAVEAGLGEKLDWQELPEGQDCRIALYTDGNIREREKWSGYFQWLQEHAEKFHKVFSDRVKKLKL